MILTFSPCGDKMILTLLEKIIASQISFTPIYVCKPALQRPFMRAFVLLKSFCKSQRRNKRLKIQKNPKNILKVIFQVSGNGEWSRNNWRSNNNSESEIMWYGGSVIAFSERSASKLVFAAKKRILRKNAASKRWNH